MSTRCTKSTLMYKGGQVDLATHAVWARTPQGPHRIKDAHALRRFDGDVEILVVPLVAGTDAPQPTDAEFSAVPDGWMRRRTSVRRAIGSGHLDKPLTDAEKSERSELVHRTAKKMTAAVTNPTSRARAIAELQSELSDLFLTHGTDRVTEQIRAAEPGANPVSVLRAIRSMPSLADDAGAPAAAFGVSHPPRPTAALAALQPAAGKTPALPVVVDASAPRSVHPHAAARWMQRIDGTIDAGLIDAARDVLRSRTSRTERQAATERLTTLLAEKGMGASYLAHTRRAIATALTTAAGAAPVFSDRRVHDYGGENDRALLRVTVAGQLLEFMVRADSVRRNQAGGSVALEVISVWPVAATLASADPWVDPAVPGEMREQWAIAAQELLIATMARIGTPPGDTSRAGTPGTAGQPA
jgi:hypothetical protein